MSRHGYALIGCVIACVTRLVFDAGGLYSGFPTVRAHRHLEPNVWWARSPALRVSRDTKGLRCSQWWAAASGHRQPTNCQFLESVLAATWLNGVTTSRRCVMTLILWQDKTTETDREKESERKRGRERKKKKGRLSEFFFAPSPKVGIFPPKFRTHALFICLCLFTSLPTVVAARCFFFVALSSLCACCSLSLSLFF